MTKRLPILDTLPDMQCDVGCTKCCSGCFPVSERELVSVLLYANEHDIKPREQGSLCPWFTEEGRCAVYEARPVVCRLFGHVNVESMTCPQGYNTNVPDDAPFRAELRAQGPAVRFLHEAIPGADVFEIFGESHPDLLVRVDRLRARFGLEPLVSLASYKQQSNPAHAATDPRG